MRGVDSNNYSESEVIVLAGQIGCGKSSLAEELVKDSRGCRVSFGRYVKQVAADRGLAADREVLQSLGEQLIASMGEAGFVDAAIGILPGDCRRIVVEGARHLEVWEALRRRLHLGRVRVSQPVDRIGGFCYGIGVLMVVVFIRSPMGHVGAPSRGLGGLRTAHALEGPQSLGRVLRDARSGNRSPRGSVPLSTQPVPGTSSGAGVFIDKPYKKRGQDPIFLANIS